MYVGHQCRECIEGCHFIVSEIFIFVERFKVCLCASLHQKSHVTSKQVLKRVDGGCFIHAGSLSQEMMQNTTNNSGLDTIVLVRRKESQHFQRLGTKTHGRRCRR